MQYTAFNGSTYDLEPWLGDNVALLTPRNAALSPEVMAKLLAAFDAGYRYYQGVTGREPADLPPTTLEGRSTIAIVDATCGAGCGYLGARGIEILPDWFGAGLAGAFPFVRGFYDAMAEQGKVTSIVFYELGRNFWFYGDQLGAGGLDLGFTTGYAVVNRQYAQESSGFDLDAGDAAGQYHAQALPAIARTYFSSAEANGLNTLGQQQGIENSSSFNGSADLAAALLEVFHEHAGPGGYARFWHELGGLPASLAVQDAFDNFSSAAEAATGMDYGFLFKSGWTFLVGDETGSTLNAERHADGRYAVLGFGGDDILNGSKASESLLAGKGDDRLFGHGGADQLAAGTGNDLLEGGTGDDLLAGGLGDDILRGDAGDDSLSGDGGKDLLTGGGGADRFIFAAASESSVSAPDQITDFNPHRDQLVFKGLLHGSFDYLAHEDFSASGNTQARLDTDAHRLEVDIDGNGLADMAIMLLGGASARLDANAFSWV